MTRGGVVPWGRKRNWVCDTAVICASAVAILTWGWKNTFTTATPSSDCDSRCSILSTVVVNVRSVWVTMRAPISTADKPWYCHTTLTTGISMLGKMLAGVLRIESGPRITGKGAKGAKLGGRRRGNQTIHIFVAPP